MSKVKTSYDPGKPALIRHEGGARYTVQSFRDPGTFYAVDLERGTCTCPHHARKGVKCKHQIAAEETAYRRAYRTAMTLSTETLRRHLGRDDLREELREGIRGTLKLRAEMEKITRMSEVRL